MYSPERSAVRVNQALRHKNERFLCLDDRWQFCLDPDDMGMEQRWFEKPDVMRDIIHVPGCWQGQGFGNDDLDEIWDFKIKARIFQATYHGTAWYGYKFRIPDEWIYKTVWVNFGGVHPSADVFLNGIQIGSHSGPYVPFGYNITSHANPREENFLAVRVHERDRYLGFAFNFAGLWSGLYRNVELSATGDSYIQHCWIHPDLEKQKLHIRIQIEHIKKSSEPIHLVTSIFNIPENKTLIYDEQPVEIFSNTSFLNFSITMPNVLSWSPDNPNLYRVDISLQEKDGILDALSERVGFVTFSVSGKHILINGEPYYLRGAGGDFNVCPDTGSPNASKETWIERLKLVRSYGFNYVRFQSSVPCPEYFDAADEVGLLVQSEMGMLGAWHGHGRAIAYAYPWPTPEFYLALKWQWEKTVMRDANHPSAAIYCMSNEMGDLKGYKNISGFPDYAKDVAEECNRITKTIHPSSLVIWTDGGYDSDMPADFCNDEASRDESISLPTIQHEFRWWTSYPDVRTKHKYTGAMRPYSFEITEKNAIQSGISELLPMIAQNSQHLQAIERKGKMEALRRDYPNLAGISVFSASDCIPSCQGLWDDFWTPKSVSADEFIRTNGDSVVLIDRDFSDRVLVAGEDFHCTFYLSDFSHPPMTNASLSWEFLINENAVNIGKIEFRSKPFQTSIIEDISFTLPFCSQPYNAILKASIADVKQSISNEWNFWLFPSQIALPKNVVAYQTENRALWDSLGLKIIQSVSMKEKQVLVSGILDDEILSYVANGGRLLLLNPKGFHTVDFKAGFGSSGGYFFTKPAHYPPYEDGNCGTIIRKNEMLGDFPHDGFADLQFHKMIAETAPYDMSPFIQYGIVPIIQAFGSPYAICPQRGYIFESAVGKGGIIFCRLKIDSENAAAVYLLSVLLKYADSISFRPKKDIRIEDLRNLRIGNK